MATDCRQIAAAQEQLKRDRQAMKAWLAQQSRSLLAKARQSLSDLEAKLPLSLGPVSV